MDLSNYLPDLYKNILEFSELIKSENFLFNQLENKKNRTINNIYIPTCDITTVKKYEALFGIYDTSNSDLEFRRQRVLNRLNMSIPFTLQGLKHKLNEILGKDYEVNVDNQNYTLWVASKRLNKDIFTETYITLNKMVPANMIFITEPILPTNILFNETLKTSTVNFNYKLGSWKLNKIRFGTRENEEVVKMANISSLNPTMLSELRQKVFDSISYIKLNDTLVINSFLTKEIVDDSIIVEYLIPTDVQFNKIEKIEIYDYNDELKSSSTLNIPCLSKMAIKHITKLYEGV